MILFDVGVVALLLALFCLTVISDRRKAHKMTFTEWYQKNKTRWGMYPPPMSEKEALNFLCDYLLGEDWGLPYVYTRQQVNFEIVKAILTKYSDRFNAERSGK